MGRLFLIDLEGEFYSCKHCQTPIVRAHYLISRGYKCVYGRAYLFHSLVNVSAESKDRMNDPESHTTVVDTFCIKCGSIVGWKYESTLDQNLMALFMIARSKILGHGEDPLMPALEDIGSWSDPLMPALDDA